MTYFTCLWQETNKYFKTRRGKSLSASDQCEFLNLWYVAIIINDILTLVGTGYKIQLEIRVRGLPVLFKFIPVCIAQLIEHWTANERVVGVSPELLAVRGRAFS